MYRAVPRRGLHPSWWLPVIALTVLVPGSDVGALSRSDPQPRFAVATWHHELAAAIPDDAPDPRRVYVDERGEITAAGLAAFLARQKSPMAPHAEEIILAANRYGVDPRIVVAIAGEESGYGRVCRGFNAWGWDGGRKRWRSWPESIDAYSHQLALKYPNHRDYRRIAARYNPPSPDGWARKVALHLRWLEAGLGTA